MPNPPGGGRAACGTDGRNRARTCDLLDEGVSQVRGAIRGLPQTEYRYEADTEAGLLLLLIIRNVEAVTTLARRDLVLLPAAIVVARAAFEASTLACWLLFPTMRSYESAAGLATCILRSDGTRPLVQSSMQWEVTVKASASTQPSCVISARA